MDLRTGGIVLGHFEVVAGIFETIVPAFIWIMKNVDASARRQYENHSPELALPVAGMYTF